MFTTISALADHFTSAAIDGQEWLPALKALADATNSTRGQLIGIGGPAAIPFNWINDFSQEEIDRVVAAERADPLINTRVHVSLGDPVLTLRSEVDYRVAQQNGVSDLYAEMCRQYRIPNGCQMKLAEDRHGMVGLAVLRTEGDGETSVEDRSLFAAVAPHVRSAVRMQHAMEHEGAQLMLGAFDQVAAAVFICDMNGRIRAMTGTEESILSSGRLRRVAGRLTAPAAKDNILLQQALARHGAAMPATIQTLILGVNASKRPMILDICAAPRRRWSLEFGREVLVIARTGERWHDSATMILKTAFRLSDAEADVALRLSRGQTREAIAEARGTSIDTVRGQLKAIFTKLDITRELDLTVLLNDMLRL